MTTKLYLSDDYVVQRDDYGTEMFFILEGEIICYHQNGRDVFFTLQEGHYFGERSLLHLTKRLYPMVARDFCLTLNLSKEKFDEVLSHFPEIELNIRKEFEKHIANL